MVFDFLKGQFIDVIHWVDDTRDTMVWRFDRHGHAIMYGAKLTVREGQAAVFIHEGQLADVFGPGLYMLETNNMPVMTALQHWDHGFSSPFKSEVYFVNTTRFNGLKWGTRNPIICRDPEFGPVRLRAFGTYSMRVTDPGRFMVEIVGTDGEFTTDEITMQLRNVIVQEFSRTIAASGIPVLDMAANTADLGRIIAKAIEPAIAAYGLSVPEFYIENVSLPEEVEKVLDKRTSMGIVGDLNRYTQFSAAEAMGAAAATPNSGMGAGIGAGLGMAMGQQMAQAGPWGTPAAAAAPPPPPPVAQWHLAVNGQTSGPFTPQQLAEMAARGAFGAASLVWTAGQDGWKPASEVPALAGILSQLPPPPPPAG
ncbi:SPFH domain-containing protein [Ruixingdingia sedimenti]|uniref:SPFH domain-containing protein n=1 Tax=Ruixingdingia sedimenti TaxID=3073604 RepID=A0ABU1F5A6_9RHOB|nr:SPFH domain-containing protein [Xinfangfangia sp. LG-4]MDR5652061.1 SPFH domain-containing protein [Xinfangfangia sp. LG-4]